MRRRDKSRGKAVKAQRRNALKRRNAPKIARRSSSLAANKETNVARLTRERDEALKQLAATSEVLRVISSSAGELEPIFQTMLANATQICEAAFGSMLLVEGNALRRVAMHNAPPMFAEFHKKTPVIDPRKIPDLKRLTETKRVVHVADAAAENPDNPIAKYAGARTLVVVPMLKDGDLIGAIAIYRQEVRPFTNKQIELVSNFAAQAVIAIENTRLLNELRQRTDDLSEALEQQTATSEVLKVISSSPGELEPVFNAMLANATRICEATIGTLYLREGSGFRGVALHHTKQSYVDFWLRNPVVDVEKNPGIPLDRLARTKQIVHIPDLRTDQSYIEKNDRVVILVEQGDVRTFVAVPMLKEGELIGAINLYRQEVQPFTDKQIELVQNFAAQAVIAIENTRLLNELRQSLDQQTATSEVLQVISSSPGELEPVFQAMLENAVRICEAKFGVLVLCEGEAFRHVAGYGTPPAYAELRRREPLIHPGLGAPLRRLADTKQVVRVLDLLEEPARGQLASLAGSRSQMLVPMLKDNKLVGAITIFRQEVQPFTDKQIELVQNFGAQAVIAIENAQLLNELRQRTDDLSEALEQQTATSDVLSVISSSPGELEPVFSAMLENATRLCEARYGTMWLREGDAFRAASLHGPLPPAYSDLLRSGTLFRAGPDTPTGRVAQTRQPVQVLDLRETRPYLDRDPVVVAAVEVAGIRTMFSVPMLKEDQLIGTISIYRQEILPFTTKQIELVQNFAAQAVIAIENARLLSELRESLQQQTATSDVLKVISSSLNDLKPVFETIGQRAEKLCDAEISVISMVDGDQIRLVSINGVTEAGVEAVRRIFPMRRDAETVTARTIRSAAICHIPDVLNDPLYEAKDTARASEFRGCLGVPMICDRQVIGMIFVARKYPGPFADSQIQLLKTFADQAVVAIENVRLFNETKEALAQQTATADVLKVISRSTFDLQTVLDTLTESAARLCEADTAGIVRPKGATYHWVTTYGFPAGFREYVISVPLSPGRGSVVGRALLERRFAHIPDVLADPEYTHGEAQKRGGYRSVLGVPLLREGNPIGVIFLSRQSARPFTDKQIELVSTFADQAVIAIENVRLFESVEARTRELAKSLEELRTTQDRLVQTEKLASLGQLTAGIAHEIKNPLNFVNNFSAVSAELVDELRQSLAGANLDAKLRAEIGEIADMLQGNLDKVVQHGKRADAIVKNMLLHSRAGSGEHRPVDINAIVEESLNLAWHGARAEKQGFNITLEKSFDPTAGEIDVFPQDITRVLLNLISNGFYAATKRKTEANGSDYEPTLAAATKNLGDRVEITIRDNGTGIPPEVKDKLFNPFFTTKPAGEGTGLGLSISHDIIVKQHGGSIEVDTQPGAFTEFRIILPRSAVFHAESGGRV